MIRRLLLALAGLCVLNGEAHAQASWPSRPVRLIITNSAGSAPDVVARITTDLLSRAMGQSWIVDNRPGGQGTIGASAAAKSAPDGYTFFFANGTTMAVTPHLLKSIPYDPIKDFIPVAMVIDSGPVGIAVHPDVPAKTLPELIALAKEKPGKLSYSVSVAFLEIAGAWLTKASGADMVQIQYKSTPQAMQDGVAGRVPVIFNSMGVVQGLARSGKMRLIAVTSLKRLPNWPDLPTVSETIPGYEAEGWNSLAVPAGTSMDIVNRVNKEMQVIVRSPRFLEPLQKYVWTNLNGASTPAALAEFYRAEREKWGRIVRELGIKPH
jgi:tripartite-type tricarboxylate transporter receptor subunit TctC